MATLDLTHPLATDMPVYPGTEPVRVEPSATLATDGYRTTRLDLDSHAGTHVDAPAHLTDMPSLDDLSPARFQFTAAAVDGRPLDAREAVGVEAIRDELSVDPEEIDLVAVITGWGRHWGTEAYFDHPYLTPEAGDWLGERNLDLAVDTINPDPTPTSSASDAEPDGFPVHEALFEAERLIVENLRGLDRITGRFEIRTYPLRFDGADASPVRAVALTPEETEE